MFIPQVTPIQPINVVVQQPPGLPVWIATLFAAAVGAVFGIGSSLLTEYLKHRLRVRKVGRQLGKELMRNMDQVGSGARILNYAKQKKIEDKTDAVWFVRANLLPVNSERYDHISSADTDLMYEIDESKNLNQFYSLAKSIAFVDSGSDQAERHNFMRLNVTLDSMAFWGRKFIEEHRLKYVPVESTAENAYELTEEEKRRGLE